MKKLFFGGIHPADKKNLTADKELTTIQSPEYVIIPLRQHIGAPCNPLVKVGDYVFAGQKIGDNEGLCAPVHASVSGTVTAIEMMAHPGGGSEMSIVIKNDYKDAMHEGIEPYKNPEEMSAQDLFWMIREAGIVGMGGATFPTEIKAISSLEKIDTLLINACECEPYITADDMLMRNWPERVLAGISFLSKALKPQHVVLAVEDNKKKAIEILKQHLGEFEGIELRVLPTHYPQGAEKQLIKAVTGREVPPGKLPSDVSCAVFNVSTVATIYQAIVTGEPLIRRIVTVTGEGINNPQNFIVPVGTPFSHLIEAAGGLKENADRVISGGPMMGKAQSTLEVPVIKGTGSILCLMHREPVKNPTCIRCGKCVGVCPMNLQPLYLYRYGVSNNMKMLDKYNLMDCMECGCCSYVCPGQLPLTEHFRDAKRALKEGTVK